jgi:hypothetical protein
VNLVTTKKFIDKLNLWKEKSMNSSPSKPTPLKTGQAIPSWNDALVAGQGKNLQFLSEM